MGRSVVTVSESPHTAQAIAPRVSQPADRADRPDLAEDSHDGSGLNQALIAGGEGRATKSQRPAPAGTPPGLVHTVPNRACKCDRPEVLAILGLRFPCSCDVSGAAARIAVASGESPDVAQIDVSPGSIQLRHKPVEPSPERPEAKEPEVRKPITSWTVKSRRRMLRVFATLDYAPLYEGDRIPMRVTLTYPDNWQAVAPDGAAVDRHFAMFERRFVRAWGEPLLCVWKREFQKRGAPHLHMTARRPVGRAGASRHAVYQAAMATWEASGQAGPRPRYRKAVGDGLSIREWLSETWADIVNHPDPEQRELHRKAGTKVDPDEVLRFKDPKRLAVYFSKHAQYQHKEYQNEPPAEWEGRHVGRFWGVRGLQPMVESVLVPRADYQVMRRTLRRWSARRKVWDAKQRRYLWVGAGKSVQVWQEKRRKEDDGGTVRWCELVKLWGPRTRMRGKSGTLCVNDGPAIAGALAQLLEVRRQAEPAKQYDAGRYLAMQRASRGDEDAFELIAVQQTPGQYNPKAGFQAPCEYGGCKRMGSQHRHGVWCDQHAAKMEWPGG